MTGSRWLRSLLLTSIRYLVNAETGGGQVAAAAAVGQRLALYRRGS